MATHKAKTIGAAACALLGSHQVAAAEAEWQVDTATMLYSEIGRVSLVEPVVALKRSWDEKSFSGKLTLDTLTGPSPNGATPASTAQIFTGPSGPHNYTAAPGEIPLDDSFHDTRVALALDYSAPLFGDWKAGYGVNFSKEYDYLSLGGSLRLQRDFNQHNTTLALGVSGSQDTITPQGGIPVPLTVVQRRNVPSDSDGEDRSLRKSSDSKSVLDLLAGVTQVLGPSSLLRVNLNLSMSSGYQTDPFKIVSVVDASGEPVRYIREGRPDSRTKTGLYTEYLRDLSGNTLRTSYRFTTDDWGITSHAIEGAYRWNFSDRNYLEPQLRYYVQSAADFYHVALFDGEETTVANASADYRLDAMSAWTVGLQAGHTLESGSSIAARLGYYVQTPKEDAVPAAAAAGLSKFGKLVPDTKAIMATFFYSFDL